MASDEAGRGEREWRAVVAGAIRNKRYVRLVWLARDEVGGDKKIQKQWQIRSRRRSAMRYKGARSHSVKVLLIFRSLGEEEVVQRQGLCEDWETGGNF